MALSVELADAVVSTLNGGLFDSGEHSDVNAARRFIPRDDLENYNGYTVFVTPGNMSTVQYDRESVFAVYDLEIGVITKAENDIDVENALTLTEEIQNALAEAGDLNDKFVWQPTYTNQPTFDRPKYDDLKLFLSVTTVQYGVIR